MYEASSITEAANLAALDAARQSAAQAHADLDAVRRELGEITERLANSRNELSSARANHERDIELIGQTLLDEANSRGWCSEFDTIVDDLNASLNVELRRHEREFDVTVTVTYGFSVTAVDADAASDIAANEYADYDYYPQIEVTGIEEA